jgi:2-polyprenyl-3-methyl-5-hydroxy-6-metoxy-1,4-benzoquinol methylase
MLRKILHLSTSLGLELVIARVIKAIPWLNAFLLKNGWSDKNDKNSHLIYDNIKKYFSAAEISLGGKKILEIGSGRAYSLGALFISQSHAKSFLASDPFNKHYDGEQPPVDAHGITFEKIDFTNVHDIQKYEKTFDVVLSTAVLEHIHRDVCEQLVKNMNHVLAPGGYAFHQIDFKDHFNGKHLPFNFYKYSNTQWEAATRNTIFYTNRLRYSDWKHFFQNNGFQIINLHKYHKENPTFPKKIASDFRSYGRDDLEVRAMDILVQKVSSR